MGDGRWEMGEGRKAKGEGRKANTLEPGTWNPEHRTRNLSKIYNNCHRI